MPEDIRIEKWIFDNYPELWKSQQDALNKQTDDIMTGISQKIKEVTPEFIYNGSGIINLFYLRNIKDIIKPAALKAIKKTSFYERGIEIFSETIAIMKKENTLSNSIEISNYLAKSLGFEGWFKWKDFEDIPAGYEDAIAY